MSAMILEASTGALLIFRKTVAARRGSKMQKQTHHDRYDYWAELPNEAK
jgi:hypothetical protein